MKTQRFFRILLVLTFWIAVGLVLRVGMLNVAASNPEEGSATTRFTENQESVAPLANEVHVVCDPGTDISDEIQTAVETLEPLGGGTIYLPSGDFLFNNPVAMPGGINIIGQGQAATILRSDGSMFFDINHYGAASGAFRITGISFYGAAPESGTYTQSGISITNIVNFRIDHCYFERILYNIGVRSGEDFPQSRGVVDHSSFIAKDLSSAYGVFDTRAGTDWQTAQTKYRLGTAQATFVEDCYFEDMGHPTASFDGGHYVLRHSTIVDSSSIDAHGPGFGCCLRGARATEIYENEIYHNSDSHGWTSIGLRAGGGVIFNNTFQNYGHAVRFSIDTYGYNATGGQYPTLDQIHDMWIWDNTLIDIDYDPSDPDYEDDLSNPNRSIVSGVLLYANEAGRLIQLNRDFYMRSPSKAQDGFEYRPYTYPHPLTKDLTLRGNPADQAIHLNWDLVVGYQLPPATTWQIEYYTTTLTSTLTISGIPESARAHTLTDLTNYEWYTVTLTTQPTLLTETIRIMPTDQVICLPMIQNER